MIAYYFSKYTPQEISVLPAEEIVHAVTALREFVHSQKGFIADKDIKIEELEQAYKKLDTRWGELVRVHTQVCLQVAAGKPVQAATVTKELDPYKATEGANKRLRAENNDLATKLNTSEILLNSAVDREVCIQRELNQMAITHNKLTTALGNYATPDGVKDLLALVKHQTAFIKGLNQMKEDDAESEAENCYLIKVLVERCKEQDTQLKAQRQVINDLYAQQTTTSPCVR